MLLCTLPSNYMVIKFKLVSILFCKLIKLKTLCNYDGITLCHVSQRIQCVIMDVACLIPIVYSYNQNLILVHNFLSYSAYLPNSKGLKTVALEWIRVTTEYFCHVCVCVPYVYYCVTMP